MTKFQTPGGGAAAPLSRTPMISGKHEVQLMLVLD